MTDTEKKELPKCEVKTPLKPKDYQGEPATVYTMHKSREPMNSYLIIGDNLPKVGDLIRISWKNKQFIGTVVEFTSKGVLRLRKSK